MCWKILPYLPNPTAPNIPRRLREFLGDTNYTFVGVGITNDVRKLREDYGLEVAKSRDLSSWAANELEKKELNNGGLKSLVKEILGKEMDKPKIVTLSRWNNRVLSNAQVAYACLDAYFSFELGRQLSAWCDHGRGLRYPCCCPTIVRFGVIAPAPLVFCLDHYCGAFRGSCVSAGFVPGVLASDSTIQGGSSYLPVQEDSASLSTGIQWRISLCRKSLRRLVSCDHPVPGINPSILGSLFFLVVNFADCVE
ncbi:hypothetical protein ACS0TY_025210 [Phlomoides rotata]